MRNFSLSCAVSNLFSWDVCQLGLGLTTHNRNPTYEGLKMEIDFSLIFVNWIRKCRDNKECHGIRDSGFFCLDCSPVLLFQSHDPKWLPSSCPNSRQQECRRAERPKGCLLAYSVPLSRLPKRQNCFISYFLDQTESCGFLAARVAREPGKHSILFLPQCAQLDIWVLFLLKEGWNRRWGKQLGAPTSQL